MKKIILIFLFLFSFQCNNIFAEEKLNSNRILIGLGEALRPLSFRYGFSNIDIGMLNMNAIGFASYLGNSNYYASFGPVYLLSSNSFGFFGGLGMDFKFFNFIYLKTELNTSVSVSNYSTGSALIGIGIFW